MQTRINPACQLFTGVHTRNMKKIRHLVILIILPVAVFGQKDYWTRLSISGAVSELGISPSEEIWIATKAGNVYHSQGIGELWHLGPFGSLNPYEFSSGKTFERVNFFSEDTLMISGFIQEDGRQNFVYWSGDHGKTWEKIKFGKSSWIDAAYVNDNGKAWMSGNSQLIYYTEDHGKTWESFDKVEPTGNLRFSTIHFAKDEQTGLFGSFWNVLYRTLDNCQNWEKLPTPLSQGKYQRLSKEHRPEISKVRIFGDRYIINQQGRVFITQSNSIGWTYLPDVIDFEVSENENLFTINRDLSISLYNPIFTKIWHSQKSLENHPRAIGVRNNSLFVLAENLHRINPNDFTVSPLYTDDIPIQEPYLRLEFEGEEYGFDHKDVLRYDTEKMQWRRVMTLNFAIANATLFDNKIIVSAPGFHRQYSVNPGQRSVKAYDLPENLFSDLVVTELHFENGSHGCFHADNDIRTYIRKGDNYVVDRKSSSPKYLSRSGSKIEAGKINYLIDVIDQSQSSMVSLSDLDITEDDVEKFKKFIDKEEQRIKKSGIEPFDFENLYSFPGENTNFNFCKLVADSLSTLPDKEINNAFWQAYGNRSTTKDWRRIILVFHTGEQLIIENSDDKPNYLYTPWIVDFEGLKFRTNSVLFGQQIDEIMNGQFFQEIARDKNYAIFKIADYLYRRELKEN